MKKLLRTFFSLSMIYCLLLPFTASTKETGTSMKTTANATAHEIAKIDAKELLVLLQASNEEKVILKAENTSLQQKVQDLTNTNSTSDKHLQDLIIQLNNRIDRLESRSNNYSTSKQLEILTTSFYERLRSTDDSVGQWATSASILGVLITVTLGALALFHVGRIRAAEGTLNDRLEEARRENRMAVNEAIRNAKKAATEITHKWVQEEGAKEIKIFVKNLHRELDSVSESIETLKNNEKIAIETTSNIQKKEKDLALQAQKTTISENNSIAKHLDIAPKNLNNDFNKLYTLAQDTFSQCSSLETLRAIKEIQNLNLTDTEKKQISIFQLLVHRNNKEYKKVISFYDSHQHSFFVDKPLTYFNKSVALLVIVKSYFDLQQYSAAYQIADQALKSVTDSKDLIFNVYELTFFHFESSLILGANLENSISFIDQHLEIALAQTEISEATVENFNNLKFRAKGHHLGLDKVDIFGFINDSDKTISYINRAANASHMLLTMKEWDKCIELCRAVSKSLLYKQKRHAFNHYCHIFSNHAYALYNSGQTTTAYRMAKFIDKKINDGKITSIMQSGIIELEEMLAHNIDS
ncbi:hypothetical protein L4C37_05890 [Vibrio kagoshimensis]|uniref:hypothetical protein n=1 Tax=Vibrio kagoshimensis TaxID=2910244 RepID=UPI003D21384C